MAARTEPLEGKHVLVVDDDLELALMYESLLQMRGYRVSTASNGAHALKVVMNNQVDAILCDLHMPELAGDLFYFEVGRAKPHLLKRFVFITGNAENPLYQSFLRNVKAPVLHKPVSFERLSEQLQAVLQSEPQPAT